LTALGLCYEGIKGHVRSAIEAAPILTGRLNTVERNVSCISTTNLHALTPSAAHGWARHRCRFEGLYLGSAGIHPGGGVKCMAGRAVSTSAWPLSGEKPNDQISKNYIFTRKKIYCLSQLGT